MDNLKITEALGASLVRSAAMPEAGKPFGQYTCQQTRVEDNSLDEAQWLLKRIAEASRNGDSVKVALLNQRFDEMPRRQVGELDAYNNLVTDVGAKFWLDLLFGTGTFTAAFMGLKGTGTAVVADTQASHGSWLEQGAANAPTYSGTRKTPAWSGATGSGANNRQKATSAASAFTFGGNGTVFGSFININGTSAIDNTTGTLFSAGDFSGSKAVVSTDVLNVTYTLNI